MRNNNSGGDEILGTGNFGVVKKAVWTTNNGTKVTVAVKCLHDALNQQAFVDIVNEISCMCNLNHPNLIKLYGIVLNNNNGADQNGMVMMVTELAPFGSLYSYLKKFKLEKKYPTISQLYSFVYQIGIKSYHFITGFN
jgi:activated CDC42 kinase 1